jgi:L-fuconate dehydratase
MLKEKQATKAERETKMREEGYPAYVTSAGWIGQSTYCRPYCTI